MINVRGMKSKIVDFGFWLHNEDGKEKENWENAIIKRFLHLDEVCWP